MKYLIIFVLALALPTLSQTIPPLFDTLLSETFALNGISYPRPQDANFFIVYNPDSTVSSLTIRNYGLKQLPTDFWTRSRSGLAYYDFSGNALTAIPSGFQKLVSAETLIIDNNQITDIPSSVSNMTWLKYLGASHNQILGFNASLFTGNPGFKAMVSFSYNKIGCPPNQDWITISQKAYIDAHDVNPDWLSTQDCGASQIAIPPSPDAFNLSCSPNPFTTTTSIKYTLPASSNQALIQVYDIRGALIHTLVDNAQGAGHYSINFTPTASGTYLTKSVINGHTYTNKLLMVR
jgi:hypothetical protein